MIRLIPYLKPRLAFDNIDILLLIDSSTNNLTLHSRYFIE